MKNKIAEIVNSTWGSKNRLDAAEEKILTGGQTRIKQFRIKLREAGEYGR